MFALFKSDRFLPMHLRKKNKQSPVPNPLTFELIPKTGSLDPGQRANIQVKFMPTKEQRYTSRVTIRLAQSSRKVLLQVNGEGKEPALELEGNLLEFGPILPHSVGEEKSVVLKNPGNAPIEIYSVEFDQQYLDEERVISLHNKACVDEEVKCCFIPRSSVRCEALTSTTYCCFHHEKLATNFPKNCSTGMRLSEGS